MERLVGIGEAAQALGVSITTRKRWEASGKLSAIHTAGDHRRYDLAKLKPELFHATSQVSPSPLYMRAPDAKLVAPQMGSVIAITPSVPEA